MVNKIVIFEQDAQTKEVILNYLSDNEDILVDKCFSDYHEGLKYVKESKIKVVLFSMSEDKTLSLKMVKRLAEYGCNVIVLSEDYTTANIIQSLRYGAKDFVSKPVLKKDLTVALVKCFNDDVKTLNKSQVISVFSNKGGVGKTTVATNLAVEFAKSTREKVVLVDLNSPIGDVATFLDVKPAIGISSLISNPNLDNDTICDACVRYKDSSLYILAEPQYLESTSSLKIKNVLNLFEHLREKFSYIVIDMGTTVDKLNMEILHASDLVFLLTVVNLPLIRNCQRCLDLFENLKIDNSKIKVIVNRYLENDEIKISDVEKTLNRKVYWKIPNNYFTIMSSINKGIPVSEVNENSNITESFTNLALKLSDDLFKNELNDAF